MEGLKMLKPHCRWEFGLCVSVAEFIPSKKQKKSHLEHVALEKSGSQREVKPTWSTASSSGAPNTGRTWMCWSGSRGGL